MPRRDAPHHATTPPHHATDPACAPIDTLITVYWNEGSGFGETQRGIPLEMSQVEKTDVEAVIPMLLPDYQEVRSTHAFSAYHRARYQDEMKEHQILPGINQTQRYPR